MFNHEPVEYVCPFCKIISGLEDKYANKQDIVYQNKFATAKIAPYWWSNNPGSLLVVPNKHFENIYDIPDDLFAEVYKVVKKVSIAIRSTYDCNGISTRQHNEPAGSQVVWHLHIHVIPRFENDMLYQGHDNKVFASAEQRLPFANKLRKFFELSS